MEQNNNNAVIGGAGKEGRYLVQHLINQGYNVKALTINPKNPETENLLNKTIVGGVTNYESVHSLIKDCDVLISTLGQTKGKTPVFSRAKINIIKAMNSLHKEDLLS